MFDYRGEWLSYTAVHSTSAGRALRVAFVVAALPSIA